MLGTNFENPCGRWTKPKTINEVDLNNVHGHIFALTSAHDFVAYEYQDGPMPDLSGIEPAFFTELIAYLIDNRLSAVLGLQVLGSRRNQALSFIHPTSKGLTITMDDAVRPAVKTRRAVFEKGFRVWLSLYNIADKETIIPESCFQVQGTFAHLPHFPPDIDLKDRHGSLYARGTSIWSTHGPREFPFLEKTFDIPISIISPTGLTLSSDPNLDYRNWFGCEEDHISVLILAWSYILSARWAELMSGSVLGYTGSQPTQNDGDQDAIFVDVGDVNSEAARWWAAVLAPGEGWRACISSDEAEYKSPWSILLQSGPGFRLPCHGSHPPMSAEAISSATALHYLSEYCNLHNAMDQSHAALSAALMLPLSNSRGYQIRLPTPKLRYGESAALKARTQIDHKWLQTSRHLDKLLVLSCSTRGVQSLLSSVFYDPGVACNLVSPWLQATFAILDSVDDNRLVHIMTRRVPRLAFLWLGAIITCVHGDVLRDARFGLIPVELHAAMWTGTIQSFIQEPIPQPPAVGGSISRANECRLLYLMQKEYHTRWPTCQWTPFGDTALEDTDMSVRSYAKHIRWELIYVGWKWTTRDGKLVHQVCDKGLTPTFPESPQEPPHIPISYDALDLEEESASENATRNIFGWLRFEGFPGNEKEIYSHEWFDLGDSDEEALCGISETSIGNSSAAADVEAWINHNAF
ncbi:uncharacterized protein GIQ15_03599 [Arthroderma uncinatum]|uniref:uncharacterized protein n=1 Tax=Arthroderma uncinatum TaxID=74035 RepID=UPI00144A996D|nr:uncharacterized protein GIQ15_03599 [Arthroderma uncinatum]KAF3484275.1 hypothetical protein GIQ15_03599 [Arthroderma uncinatum]